MCRKISKMASDVKAEILDGARNCRARQEELDPGTSIVELDPGTCPHHTMKGSGRKNENIDISVEVQLSDEENTKLHGEMEEGFHENQATGGLSNIMECDDHVDRETYYANQFKRILRSHVECLFASDSQQNMSPCLLPQTAVDGMLNQTSSADGNSRDLIKNDIFDLLSIY